MMRKGAKKGQYGATIDKAQFEALCGLFCSMDEIMSFFDVSSATLERWCVQEYGESFLPVWKSKSAKGRISLRRIQMRLADKSVPMAIFLGKQYLGQNDDGLKEEQDAVEIANDVPRK